MWAMAGLKYGLIRPDGTWALEPAYSIRRELSDGLAAVWNGDKIGFIDRTGRMVIPPKFEPLGTGDFEQGMPAPAKVGGRVGLIDRSGNWVIEPTYSSIFSYSADGASNPDLFRGFVAKRGPIKDILDRTGKVLIGGMTPWQGTSSSRSTPGGGISVSTIPGQMRMFCDDGRIIGFFDRKPRLFERDGTPLDLRQGELWWPLTCDAPYVVKIDNRFVHVDRWLRPLTAEKFDALGLFRDGLAAVALRGKHGLIRDDGTWAIEPRFDAALPIGRDLAIVTLDGRSGVFNVANDRWVTDTPFDDICGRLPSFIGVVLNGKNGVIDASGAWVIQPKHDALGIRPRLRLDRSPRGRQVGLYRSHRQRGYRGSLRRGQLLRARHELVPDRRRVVRHRSPRRAHFNPALPDDEADQRQDGWSIRLPDWAPDHAESARGPSAHTADSAAIGVSARPAISIARLTPSINARAFIRLLQQRLA